MTIDVPESFECLFLGFLDSRVPESLSPIPFFPAHGFLSGEQLGVLHRMHTKTGDGGGLGYAGQSRFKLQDRSR